MVQDNPPLFVQDGEYNARMDRNLIGASLAANGVSSSLVPRVGVRPYHHDGTKETSLLVTISNGQTVISPGSAFVLGPAEDGIGGVYLVTNPSNTTPPLVPPVIPGADQKGLIGISVTDPGDTPVAGAAEGKWEFVYYETVPTVKPRPRAFLPLAEITVPMSGAAPTVADKRLFTTMHGGALQIASFDTIKAFPRMPLGSQAFATTEDRMYVRAKGGWEQPPALAKLSTGSNTFSGHPGQLLYNTGILSVYDGTKWVEVGRPSAVARKATDTTWPDRANEVWIDKDLKLEFTKAGVYYSIGASTIKLYNNDANEKKPTEAQLSIEVKVPAVGTLITAYLRAHVKAFKKDGESLVEDESNTFTMNLDVSTATKKVFDENGKPEGYQQLYSLVDENGNTYSVPWMSQNFYKPMNMPATGIVTIRPMFKATKLGYFEITDMRIQVNTT